MRKEAWNGGAFKGQCVNPEHWNLPGACEGSYEGLTLWRTPSNEAYGAYTCHLRLPGKTPSHGTETPTQTQNLQPIPTCKMCWGQCWLKKCGSDQVMTDQTCSLSHKRKPMPSTAWMARNLKLQSSETLNWDLAPASSSDSISQATDGGRNRDPHPNIRQSSKTPQKLGKRIVGVGVVEEIRKT